MLQAAPWHAVLLLSSVAAAVPLAAQLTNDAPLQVRGAASALSFLFLAGILMSDTRSWQSVKAEWLDFARALALSTPLFVVLALFAGTEAKARWPVASAILLSAWSEEVAFRALLPSRVERLLSTSWQPRSSAIVATILAQALFCVCHFLPGSSRPPVPDWFEASRIFAGGVLYWLIVDTVGLWLAVGLHGWLNLNTLFTTQPWDRPSPATVGVIAGAALVALWARSARSPHQPDQGELLVNRAPGGTHD